jgi:hypothetical protein
MSKELKLPDVECRQCGLVIDWNGECKCERPYEPMTGAEYKAHFIHPFMRRSMPNVIDKPAGDMQ